MSDNPNGVPGAGEVTFSPAEVAAVFLAEAQAEAKRINDNAVAIYVTAAVNWTAAATQARDYGNPLPPKPQPPKVFHVDADPNGWPLPTYGPEELVPLVADLTPIVPKPPVGNVHVGVQNTGTSFSQAFPDDTVASGTVILYNGFHLQKHVTPFGGYYEQLS